jgi:putative hydrolase of HD superfamily
MADQQMREGQAEVVVQFLRFADELKGVERRNFVLAGRRRENSAEHSWHLCLAALLLAPEISARADLLRVLKLLVVHDLVEVYAGDLFAYDVEAQASQRERERAAAGRMLLTLPVAVRAEFADLWREYEQQSTPDARAAMAMDVAVPVILNHAARGGSWSESGVRADRVMERLKRVEMVLPSFADELRRLVDEMVRNGWVLAAGDPAPGPGREPDGPASPAGPPAG